MLLLRNPKDEDKYIMVDNFNLSFWLQRNDFYPRYMWENIYYYYKEKKIEDAIKTYKAMQCESEVSEFGKDI